jgi:lipopolysaccharide export LptBFGC system permease protein LptF
MSGRRSDMREDMTTARELLIFFWQGRAWWLAPIVFMLLLLSFVLVFIEGSAVAPFIYALF